MTSSPAPARLDTDPKTTSPLSWRVHPLRQESAARTTCLLALIFAVSAMAAWSLEHILFGLISLVVLALSMARYLLPTDYVVDDQGVTTKNLGVARRLTWRQINRIDVHADGLFLSPFRVPSRLDGFRGLFVRYADNQAQVAVAIDDHRRAHDGTAS